MDRYHDNSSTQRLNNTTMRRLGSFLLLSMMITSFSCTKQNGLLPDQAQGGLSGNGTSTPGTAPAGNMNMMPNELLVQFKEGVGTSQRAQVLSVIGASVREQIHTNAMKQAGLKDGIFLLQTNMNALDALNKISGEKSIAFAEPNYIYQHAAVVPNDASFPQLWGMQGGYGINATVAWMKSRGSTDPNNRIYVGIIDEGVMHGHADLAANFTGNPAEKANGIDDDGNGFIDDTYGWDFVSNDKSVFDGASDDHGSHVAGTIGAVGNNTIGVTGVNWNVSLLSAKFLGTKGGTTANAIKAVDYFTNLKNKGIPIVATNNSWGGGGYSQGLYDAIERANRAGILFIAAAGNNGVNIDASPQYPAAYANSNIISVAAIASNGTLASFSNYGAGQVDIGAPGVGILSTIPTSSKGRINSSYASYNGTSMATPHVTGACALYKAIYPLATAENIKSAILLNAAPTASLGGKVATGGRLDMSRF